MMEKILLWSLAIVALPGIIIAAILGFFVRYGDGTGNESGLAGFFMSAMIANAAFYAWLAWYLLV